MKNLACLVLALMLRVWWPSSFLETGGTGVVLGTVMDADINTVYLVVRQDNGKVRKVDVDIVEKSSWEEAK